MSPKQKAFKHNMTMYNKYLVKRLLPFDSGDGWEWRTVMYEAVREEEASDLAFARLFDSVISLEAEFAAYLVDGLVESDEFFAIVLLLRDGAEGHDGVVVLGPIEGIRTHPLFDFERAPHV